MVKFNKSERIQNEKRERAVLNPYMRRAKAFTLTLAIISVIYTFMYGIFSLFLLGRHGVDWAELNMTPEQIEATLNPPVMEVLTTYFFTVLFLICMILFIRNLSNFKWGRPIMVLPYYLVLLAPIYNLIGRIISQVYAGIYVDVIIILMAILVLQSFHKNKK
jgi:hypothetical protein